MDYPPAVLEKAQRLEQLLLRIASGEALDEANEALGFDLDQQRLARCQAKYEAGGCTWEALIDGRHGHSRQAHSALREWLYVRKKEDDSLRAPQLVIEIEEKFGVTLSAGHVNYLLRKRGLSAPPGHPPKRRRSVEEASTAPATHNEKVDNAGIFFPRSSESGDGGS
jgi:transposase